MPSYSVSVSKSKRHSGVSVWMDVCVSMYVYGLVLAVQFCLKPTTLRIMSGESFGWWGMFPLHSYILSSSREHFSSSRCVWITLFALSIWFKLHCAFGILCDRGVVSFHPNPRLAIVRMPLRTTDERFGDVKDTACRCCACLCVDDSCARPQPAAPHLGLVALIGSRKLSVEILSGSDKPSWEVCVGNLLC